MASVTSRRAGNGISWTLQYATRSRTFSFSYSTLEHSRGHRRRQQASEARFLSTSCRRYQEASNASPRPTTSTSNTATATRFGSNQPSGPSNMKPRPAPTSTPREPPPSTARSVSAIKAQDPIRDVTETGLSDAPITPMDGSNVDWTTSFHGLSTESFSKETQEILLQPLNFDDIEIKPDGIVFLPEIKYRRILNRAFGPGGWGLAPRGETIVTSKCVTREYALLAKGRLVSIARGEQDYFDPEGVPTATEGCKSNALMRCCKDLGVASELWDPRFIQKFLMQHAREMWVEHAVTKKKKKITMRKDDEPRYPFKESKTGSASGMF